MKRIRQFIMKHMTYVPPEQQITSRHGLFSGYRLTFTDREKTVLIGLLVIIVIAILVIGTIRIMSKG